MALLVALAVLAERASARSLPVRWLVLAFLRQAEAVARDFVAATAQVLPPALDEAPAIRNGRADAILLAGRLRALAARLGSLLRSAGRFACSNARIGGVFRRFAPRPGQFAGAPGCQPKHNDTS